MRVVLALLGACQEFTVDKPEPELPQPIGECDFQSPPEETVPVNPLCVPVEPPPGGFRPMVEWGAGRGESCLALPTVGDLDNDGMPEVVTVFSGVLPGRPGDLVVLHGDGSGVKWRKQNDAAYGAAVALGDLDDDGRAEIVVPIVTRVGVLGLTGDYAVQAYNADGDLLWESEEFTSDDFDYATGVVLSDMDHDGSPEIVVGRVILNADGTTRGKGRRGRGSYGVPPIAGAFASEAAVPAVADIDLDGTEEVIVGDTRYDPDGNVIWRDDRQEDGMIALANLDDDDFGEIVASTYNTVRAVDDDGSILWGPLELPGANIVSVPTIGDLDNDGSPEIVVAGGNELIALRADGSELWSVPVQDESGATGASLFDFEGDGFLEVLYIDEIQMIAVDGRTGARKFYSDEHGSVTLFDYPVIADVDADDHAEIIVCHHGFGRAVSVYGDELNSWRPARRVWNQHAYSITNINDDLTIPVDREMPWITHNTYHAGIAGSSLVPGVMAPADVGAQLLGFCETGCFEDTVEVFARLVNTSPGTIPADIVSLSLYALDGGRRILVGTELVTVGVLSGTTGGDVTFRAPRSLAITAEEWEVVADDQGGGIGVLAECAEANNAARMTGPLCLPGDEE